MSGPFGYDVIVLGGGVQRGRHRPPPPSRVSPASPADRQDLCSAAFLLDTVQYYLFLVIPAYRRPGRFPWMPVLGPKPALLSYRLMDAYNRRFKALALLRRSRGEAGRRNDGRHLKAYFNLRGAPYRMLGRGLRLWLAAEVNGLRLRVRARPGGPRPTDGEAVAP